LIGGSYTAAREKPGSNQAADRAKLFGIQRDLLEEIIPGSPGDENGVSIKNCERKNVTASAQR